MIVECWNERGEPRAINLDPNDLAYGWVYYKHPDGQWVTLRRGTTDEIARAISSNRVAHTTIIGLGRQIEMFLRTLTGIAHCDECPTCRKNAEETLAAYRSGNSGDEKHG